MPEQPVIAQRKPYIVEVGPGTVYWCQCGRSKAQPFCDGSHTGTVFSPMEIHFEEKKRMAFFSCKQTKSLPSATGLTRGSNRLGKSYWAQ
jgi:CDGSH-type Zn-finger protein